MCRIRCLAPVRIVHYCVKVRSPGGCVFLSLLLCTYHNSQKYSEIKNTVAKGVSEWMTGWMDDYRNPTSRLGEWLRWSAKEHRLGLMRTKGPEWHPANSKLTQRQRLVLKVFSRCRNTEFLKYRVLFLRYDSDSQALWEGWWAVLVVFVSWTLQEARMGSPKAVRGSRSPSASGSRDMVVVPSTLQ